MLRAKVRFHRFKSVFWRKWLIFCLLSIRCSFCNRIKTEYREFFIPIFKNTGSHKTTDILLDFYFFHYFETNCFLFKKRIFLFYCFCSLLSNCYKALLWTCPISFLPNYKLFLFRFSFILSYFDFFIKICFLKLTKIFLILLMSVVVVWLC